jgi:hypothetical protein
VYGREYKNRELRFEASGGLSNASLILLDKETDTYWSIMTGEAMAGELAGTRLDELPYGEKRRWKDWVAEHPDTLVLSVDGVENESENPYDRYYASDDGFRGLEAASDALENKAPVFAFRLGRTAYAAPHAAFEGGAVFEVGTRSVFLYRPPGEELYFSSSAFVAEGEDAFRRDGERWLGPGKTVFDPASGSFGGSGAEEVEHLAGFDTLWLNWSTTYPKAVLLGDG